MSSTPTVKGKSASLRKLFSTRARPNRSTKVDDDVEQIISDGYRFIDMNILSSVFGFLSCPDWPDYLTGAY